MTSNKKAVTDAGKAPRYTLMRVRDIPQDLMLISDSQDIAATLETIGQSNQFNDIGCMFVEVLDGDYGSVYGAERSIPYLDAIAWQIQ